MEKSVFLERYKNQPDIIRKAEYFPARVRDEVIGRMVFEMHVKMYEQKKG